MDNREFIDAVRKIHEAGQSLSSWFAIPSDDIESWTAGRARVPRSRARQVRWLVLFSDRELELQRLGITPCPWVKERDAEFGTSGPLGAEAAERYEAFAKMIDEHAARCPQCQRREASINARPLPPPPQIGFGGRLFELIVRVPPFFAPAAIGAAFLAFIVLLRLGVAVVGHLITKRDPLQAARLLGAGLVAVAAAAGAGAAAGLAFSLLRPLLRRLGTVGDYLTGVTVVFAYMSALVLVAPVAFGEALVDNGAGWWIVVGVSVLFGLFGAYVWRREERKLAA